MMLKVFGVNVKEDSCLHLTENMQQQNSSNSKCQKAVNKKRTESYVIFWKAAAPIHANLSTKA